MQRVIQAKIPPKLAFRVVGKELLKEEKFDISFEYLRRSGLGQKRAASLVSHAAEKTGKLPYALKFSRMMEDSKANSIRQGRMMLRLGNYEGGLCMLVKAGTRRENANRLGASFAFRNMHYKAAAEMFGAAKMEKEAKGAWKREADIALMKGDHSSAAFALVKSGYDEKEAYLKAAERHISTGNFSEASSMFSKAGEQEKSVEALLLGGEYGKAIRRTVSCGTPVREACASVAADLERLGKLEHAAKCYELAGNFVKAKELYRKAGNEKEAEHIENFSEPNKGWCYISEFKKIGISEEDLK
jgi:tetratricopeptide (TPR) repeat protein